MMAASFAKGLLVLMSTHSCLEKLKKTVFQKGFERMRLLSSVIVFYWACPKENNIFMSNIK